MRIKTITITPAAHDADGIADGNDSSGATVDLDGDLTSGGTFTSSDGLGRLITIKDDGADDQSCSTYTLTGTNANGEVITEDVTGPTSGATVVSTKYYKTLTSVGITAPTASSTVDIGTRNATASARTSVIPLNPYVGTAGVRVVVLVTGTINYDVMETFQNIYSRDVTVDSATLRTHTALDDNTGDLYAGLSTGASGMAIHVESYTAGASLEVTITTARP